MFGQKIAFNYFDSTWHSVTYNDFITSSRSIAAHLLNSGLKKGDRIAIISENRPEWCIAYTGIIMAGGIAVPIDAQLLPDAVKNLLADSESEIVFCSDKTAANISNSVKTKKINFDSPEFKLVIESNVCFDLPEVKFEDVASIIYTSGTTGIPKGVMLIHKNFLSDADAVIKSGIIKESDSVLSVLPLHHTYPFMCTFIVPMILGGRVVYSPSLKGSDIISSIHDKSVTILLAVPQLLELIRNNITTKIKQLPFPFSSIISAGLGVCKVLRIMSGLNIGKMLFSSVHKKLGKQFRLMASGGARLDPQVMRDLEGIGFTVIEGYGLTETSPVLTFNPISRSKIGSVGKPLSSVEIRIIDTATGKILETREQGEIAVRGPMVMKGYYKNPDETNKVIRDNWFFTGDIGFLDKENYLYITNRIKEVIVLSSGKNIYPVEIEKTYLKIPLIKEICVTEAGGQKSGDFLHAVIVPDFEYAKKNHISNILEHLKWKTNKISHTLPEYMRIKGFTLYTESLPKTPLGKLRRFMIKDLIKPDTVKEKTGDDILLIDDKTGKHLLKCIKTVTHEHIAVQAKDNLEFDLGFDSLKKIELIACLEKEFSLNLPVTFFTDIQTVEELFQKIKAFRLKQDAADITAIPDEIGFTGILLQEPADIEKKAVGLKQNRIEWAVLSLLLLLIKLSAKLFFRLEVKGINNLLKTKFIIAANHCSFLDAFLIAAAMPFDVFKNLYFLGLRKFFKNKLASCFARISHVIQIDPDMYITKALQLSAYALRMNKNLCIFPEGGRSFDGKLMEFKKGIGVLAIEMDVPVVPCFIKGSFEAMPAGSFIIKPKKIIINFGKALNPDEMDFTKKQENIDNHQFFADELRKKVEELSHR